MKRFKRIVPGKATRVVASQVIEPILAAGEDEETVDDTPIVDDFDEPTDDFSDTLDDVADDVEEIQDAVDEVQEDDVSIDIENNITGHYIAECNSCHGVFISATIESDQEITKVSGVCPLCDKETDQLLKWVIKDAGQRESK